MTSTWRRFTSSTGKTPTHPNSSKKLPPAAAEVAQHEAAEVAQHEAAEAAEAVQYEPAAAAAAAAAEASQFGEAAEAAAAAVAGLACNGRHWAGSGSANRVISALIPAAPDQPPGWKGVEFILDNLSPAQ